MGYGNGFFDITGYDNVKVNISSYDSGKDDGIRLLATAGATSTTNFEVPLKQSEANIKPLSGISSFWIAGVYTKAGSSNSQSVSGVDFIKEFNATSTTAFSIAASTSSTVSYDRTFPTDKKSTVCLPFALTESEVSAAGKFYELTSVDGTTLHFTQVSTTEAYKPYVFEASTATPFASLTNKEIAASEGATTSYTVGSYTFHGTLAHQYVPNGAYGYNASTGAFSQASAVDAVSIDAFRAYITAPSSARSLDTDFGDGTTGIEKVNQTENNYDSIYNLSGQSVGRNYKGIVIKNGKKMIQK